MLVQCCTDFLHSSYSFGCRSNRTGVIRLSQAPVVKRAKTTFLSKTLLLEALQGPTLQPLLWGPAKLSNCFITEPCDGGLFQSEVTLPQPVMRRAGIVGQVRIRPCVRGKGWGEGASGCLGTGSLLSTGQHRAHLARSDVLVSWWSS